MYLKITHGDDYLDTDLRYEIKFIINCIEETEEHKEELEKADKTKILHEALYKVTSVK